MVCFFTDKNNDPIGMCIEKLISLEVDYFNETITINNIIKLNFEDIMELKIKR